MYRIILLFIGLSSVLKIDAQCSFDVTSIGTTSEMDVAIEYATDIWCQYLQTDVPIKVNITAFDLGNLFLGFTVPNGRKNFPDAPLQDVWYVTSLANAISGEELNIGESDMDILINTAPDYYFGLDGNTSGQQDFVSLILHEIGHGLGGVSSSEVEGNVGTIGELTAIDLQPMVTSFTWLDMEGLPTIWETFIVNGEGELLINQNLFPNSSIELANELQSNDLYFNGALASMANDGISPPVFAPSNFAFGSSLNHFNENSFPTSSGNGMFTPYSAINEVEHDPGPIFLGALEDIGWNINYSLGINTGEHQKLRVFPNPATDVLRIELEEESFTLGIYDMTGKRTMEQLHSGPNTISHLQPGIYLISGEIKGVFYSERIMILGR